MPPNTWPWREVMMLFKGRVILKTIYHQETDVLESKCTNYMAGLVIHTYDTDLCLCTEGQYMFNHKYDSNTYDIL